MQELLPLATVVTIQPYDPPRRLCHVPNTQPGICPGCETSCEAVPPSGKVSAAGHDWHVDCFRCSLCREPFGSQPFVVKDDLVLHSECHKKCFSEHCAKCCKRVENGKCVNGRHFHPECFTCAKCGTAEMERFHSLYGFPYCTECFEELQDNFPTCLTCSAAVLPGADHREFFFRGRKYFVHFPNCFKCKFCPKQMTVKACCAYKDSLICKDCFDTGQKRICAECNEPVFDKCMHIENVYWHQHHFRCSTCQAELQQNTAVFAAGVLKCRDCSAEERAKCGGCGRAVTGKGVHACGVMWHGECLNCQFCSASVLAKKFANIKNKPCCVDCYQRLKSEGRIDKRGQLIEE